MERNTKPIPLSEDSPMTGLFVLFASLSPARAATEGRTFRLILRNLPETGNAVQELMKLLKYLPPGWLIVEFSGGESPDRVPESAEVLVCLPSANEDWQYKLLKPLRQLREKLHRQEINLIFTEGTSTRAPLTPESQRQLVQLVSDLAFGVCKGTISAPELTSCLAVLKMNGDTFEFAHIIKYAEEELLRMIDKRIEWMYIHQGCVVLPEAQLLSLPPPQPRAEAA